MASRPHTLLSPNPGVVAATFTAHRLGTPRDRNPAARRVVRWKERHMQTPATLDSAVIAAPSSAATVRRLLRDAEGRLASIGWCADLGETVDPSALPAVRRAVDITKSRKSVNWGCGLLPLCGGSGSSRRTSTRRGAPPGSCSRASRSVPAAGIEWQRTDSPPPRIGAGSVDQRPTERRTGDSGSDCQGAHR